MSFDLDLVLDEYSLPVGKDRRGTFAGQYSPSRMGLTVIPSFDSTEVFWQDNYRDNEKRSKYDRSHYVIKLTLPDDTRRQLFCLFKGDGTPDDSQRLFILSATQRCNIVATLFRMVTTLVQHCSAVLC